MSHRQPVTRRDSRLAPSLTESCMSDEMLNASEPRPSNPAKTTLPSKRPQVEEKRDQQQRGNRFPSCSRIELSSPSSWRVQSSLMTGVLFCLLFHSCQGKDLVIRERTSGDQEVLAFLIGFILFLSILVIASLVSRCVWRDHRISSRRHLNPQDPLGQHSSPFRNQNSDSLYPRSRSFLSSLIHDDADSDDEDDDEDEDDMNDARLTHPNSEKGLTGGSMNPHSTACPSSDTSTHEIRRNGKEEDVARPASSSFSLSSAAIHLFTSLPSSSSMPLSSVSSSSACHRAKGTRPREGQESAMYDTGPVGERTHLIQYKRLCVRIKNPDTSCGSRYDTPSHSSNSISYL